MSWVNKIDEIYLINLDKREDRLLQVVEEFEKYEIPFKRISAVEMNSGAEGLKETMVMIFTQALGKGYENVLVLEDDCKFVESKDVVDMTMASVLGNLPVNYVMIFLGCQITGKVSSFYHANLIKAQKMFSTHAVLYSKRGMKEALAQGIYGPIDNFYVEKLESLNESYATYPLLATQRPGYSDICKNEIDWSPFIQQKYNQQLQEFHGWNNGR